MNKIKICVNINTSIEISQPKLDKVIKEIREALLEIGQKLFQVLIAELNKAVIEWMRSKTITICCKRCKTKNGFTKRGFRNDERVITTSIGKLSFFHLQMIECPKCHYRFSPLLQVLGIERYQRISNELKLKGVSAAIHLPYRLARNVLGKCTGIVVSARTIWKEVQKLGVKVNLGIDKNEEASFGADGTGIPIKDSGKRGKEIKIIAQHKKKGSIRICGIGIGSYNKDWDFAKEICVDIKETFKIPLMCGDGSVYKELKKYIKGILFQRDMWHIYHSLKHILWDEGIKRSSDDYKEISGKVFSIIKLPKSLTHEEIDYKKIEEKAERMESLIDRCRELGYEKVVEYLDRAKKDLFTFANKKLVSRKLVKTNSLVERVMREINFRIDVAGAWKDQGALNIMKLRLGVIYNRLDLESLYVKE